MFIILLIVIGGIVGINAQSAQRQKEYNGHIEAAEKYLSELDYEQAIAEYALALEIEPKSEEVLSGLEQTYLAYAKSYADTGDYERAIEILEEGYAMTERASLKEKMEEYSKKLEAVKQEEEEAAQVGEIKQLVESDEFQEKAGRWGRRVGNANQYITDMQIRELCLPLIEILEQYRELYPENWQYYSELPCLYYMVGEYELCAQIYKELRELFPGSFFEPYEVSPTTIGGFVYDEYGRTIRSYSSHNGEQGFEFEYENEFEYGQNGKCIRRVSVVSRGHVESETYLTDISEFEYEYDSSGRLSKETITEMQDGEAGSKYVNTYEYSEGGFTVYTNWELDFFERSSSTINYVITNEYGDSEIAGE